MTAKELCALAIQARQHSYAPYSGYRVGAALLTNSGQVYLGCNIENAAYGPTVCAERTAIFKAVSEGHRKFSMIAIAGGKGTNIENAATPCGVCRQVLAEFCDPELIVLVMKENEQCDQYTLGELLPHSFSADNLNVE